jgi:competence ComEA-like helix-hairpin-helix protein
VPGYATTASVETRTKIGNDVQSARFLLRRALEQFGMGIYDRDYMREGDEPGDWWKPGYSIKRWLTIGIIAISLLTSVVFLGRSIGIPKFFKSHARVAKHASPVTRHEKGSLRVNINTATIEELETLPGIGPAKARLIVTNRPYQNVDDLAKLHGIGQKLTTDLRSLIKTDGTTEQLLSR